MHPISKAALLSSLVLLSNIFVFAQQNNPLINSGEIISNGTKLYEEKKYTEALKEYAKVDRSDTNYIDVLYQQSLTYYADSQVQKSLELAQLGMQLSPTDYAKFAMQVANSYDELGKPEEALKFYDSAIVRNPNAYLLHFNKGIVYYKIEKLADSKLNMQRCLLINPYYSPAHFYLGSAYLKEGNIVAAMLAFKTYLLLAPDGRYYQNVLTLLNGIANASDDILNFAKSWRKSKLDDFSMQQEILLSKIALNTQYKLQANLEDNIVRQIQVVDEKLEYNKNDLGFAMQYYVPLYVSTFKNGDFEELIFSMFANVNTKQIENWTKTNKKEKQAFSERAAAYLDEIKRTQEIDFMSRSGKSVSHNFYNSVYSGKGSFTTGKDATEIGNWEYFYPNGSLKAKGTFNDKGQKTGTWTYYYNNGQPKERSSSKDGVLQGIAEGWFDNGNKWYTDVYENGKLNGTETIYYYNGILRSTTARKEGQKNGEEKYYDIKGSMTSSARYEKDELQGKGITYHNNGQIKSEVNYQSNKEDGLYRSYYRSGKQNISGEFVKGAREGMWTTYFEDGVVSEKVTYLDGEITGEFTEYFSNGNLSTRGNYYKKKIDGKLEYFDRDGKLYNVITYERGKLREITFLDKLGKVISTTTTRKGAANITFYSPEGVKVSEGYYNKDGDKDGKYIFYHGSGKVSQESMWKDGSLNGPQTDYYNTGDIKQTLTYTDNEEDGYIKNYFLNGKLSSEGWRIQGSREQAYLYYNNLGDLTNKEYFVGDQLHGYSESYNPGKKLAYEYLYKQGWLYASKQFDSTGKIIAENNFEKGNGPLVYKHHNGKISSKGTYRNYALTGAYTYYFFDGTTHATSFYKNGMLDSTYTNYYYGGKISSVGNYLFGKKEGVWKHYYPNGKLMEEEFFRDGTLQQLDKIYDMSGNLERIISYKDGEFEGPLTIYTPQKNIAVVFNYSDGLLKSYQFEEKPNVLSAPILIKGGTGKIEVRYPNQKPSAVMTFVDNKVEGARSLYYPNGNLYVKGNRLNGHVDGLHESYYEDGTKQSESTYYLGMLHGISKSYRTNGKIEKTESHYNDDLHGDSLYYDEGGKLKQTRTYYYGVLVNVK